MHASRKAVATPGAAKALAQAAWRLPVWIDLITLLSLCACSDERVTEAALAQLAIWEPRDGQAMRCRHPTSRCDASWSRRFGRGATRFRCRSRCDSIDCLSHTSWIDGHERAGTSVPGYGATSCVVVVHDRPAHWLRLGCSWSPLVPQARLHNMTATARSSSQADRQTLRGGHSMAIRPDARNRCARA